MSEVVKYLNNLLIDNDTIIVAVSGGPDSMALLSLLLEIKNNKNINIICAHVNHNSGRMGQDEEEEYVKSFSNKNNIIFESYKIDEYKESNFEMEARSKRYSFFDELVKKYNAKYVFTAHHGDDLVETILMRIVRGSTLKGYTGFLKELDCGNYKIIRPFISLTKDDLINYLDKSNIKYYTDNSNYDDKHTRNRYRKYILPKLKEENKEVHKKFLKFSETLEQYDRYIKNEAKKIMKDIYINNKLDLIKFNKLDKLIKDNIFYIILDDIYGDNINDINDNHINLIYDLINSDKSNSYINLPDNMKAVKSYNYLEIKNNTNYNEYNILFENEIELPNNSKIYIIDKTDSDSNYVCRLNYNDIKLPLYIRTIKENDRIDLKGFNGSKKIKDIFINSKIPLDIRKIYPIVVDSNDKILWLPGLKKSKIDKTKDEKYDIILKYEEEQNE